MYRWGSLVGGKWSEREAKNSPPSSDEVKNAWSFTSTPYTSSWRAHSLTAQLRCGHVNSCVICAVNEIFTEQKNQSGRNGRDMWHALGMVIRNA